MTTNNFTINGNKNIINLNHGATITAEGRKCNKMCKPVLCIENGKVYSSMYDAEVALGIPHGYLSNIIANKGGYYKKRNLHFVLLSERDDGLDAMTTHLQKLSENYDELVAKAKAYDALMEAEAKAREEEEKRQKAIERLEIRIAKHEDKLNKEVEIIKILKAELEALMNG